MAVKISVKNLGALKQAEFTLGDLTIICGSNNTGKTYATYALFGFLYMWRRIFSIDIETEKIEQLLIDGVINLNVNDYKNHSQQILQKGCEEYTQQLSKIFASSEDRFKDTAFEVVFEQDVETPVSFSRRMSAASTEIFSITKDESDTEMVVTLLVEKEKVKIPRDFIKLVIADALKEIIFAQVLPNPFIASAERTGAAIFRKELNFARNRLLDEMGQADKTIDPIEILLKDYQDYALPIKMNVEFTRKLEGLIKKRSFITENHPDILTDFADIIGGEYMVTRNDELYYVPKGKRIRLSMDESSSAVRSLLDIGFYLRHEARYGDLLMIDEPELNLHPENQCRLARLFARLVNIGIKVFITTHSDYIVKELNTLIMLKPDEDSLRKIAIEEGYKEEELLSHNKVKVYIAEEANLILDGKIRKTKCQTLTLANIDPKLGIEVRSFDTTIETMNRIQEAIVWRKN
jgi:AAA15 family ATPase/GTPase